MKNLTIAFVAGLAVLSFAGCKNKGGTGGALAKLEEFRTAMCKCTDKQCAEKVDADMMKWSADNAEKNKNAKPSAEEEKQSEPIVKAMMECRKKAMEAGAEKPADPAAATDEPADPAAAAAPGDIPTECNDYKAMIEKLASCEKMPKETRDALKLSYEKMSQSWANVAAMPEESRKTMAKGCKDGADALRSAAASTCGW